MTGRVRASWPRTANEIQEQSRCSPPSRNDGVVVIRPEDAVPTRQGLPAFVGVAAGTAGATGICMNIVEIPAGAVGRASRPCRVRDRDLPARGQRRDPLGPRPRAPDRHEARRLPLHRRRRPPPAGQPSATRPPARSWRATRPPSRRASCCTTSPPDQRSGTSTRSRSPISRATRAGFPYATTPAGRSRVTTAPAPTTVSSPIVHPGADDHAAPEPDVVADRDRQRDLPPVAPRHRIDRVGGGQQLDVGGDLAVGADRDRRAVEHHAAEVDERAVADRDVPPVVEMERRQHDHALAGRAEQLAQQPVALAVAGGVVALAELLPAPVLRLNLGIAEHVQLAALHPLSHLGHRAIVRFPGREVGLTRAPGPIRVGDLGPGPLPGDQGGH